MDSTSKTNWERVDALSDEDVDTSDIPPLGEDFFRAAMGRRPRLTVAVEVDPETLAWYEAQGEARAERLAAALRVYAQAHRPLQEAA